MEIFSKLDWFFKANRKDYIVGVLALMIVSFLNVLPSRIIGIVIDHIANSTLTTQILLAWLGILLAIGLVQFALRYLWRVKIFGNSAKLQYILRQRLYNHFTHMDANFFQKYRTGDLMAHATNDLNNIRLVAGGGVLMVADIIAAGLTTIIAMVVVVDLRLTLMAIIPLLLLIVLARQLGKLINKRFKVSQAAFSDLNNRVQESIQGMKVIKSVGQEEADIDNFKDLSQEAALANREVKKVDASISPLITVITGVSYMIAILFGGRLVFLNEITIGDFVTFINYIGMMVWPMMAVGQLFNIVERGNASYDRIMNLMAEETSIIEVDDPIDKPISGDLKYDVDSFVYPDGQVGLKDIHFHLPEGETLGVVGRTGAGKTTLFKLLLRQYDHYEGVINYGGHDIRDYSLDALLNHIGYVPQDNFLFSDTIANNIRFSNPDLPMEEVVKAAKIAHIHDDIMGFEDGYEEVIGERGVQLSGGQKQRLTIARALITDPELLILDDSLSAVDAETEEAILNNLLDYRKGQTTIISAHRLSSVKGAGEILVMDDGQITERGTHEDLLAEGGWYQKIYQAQQLQESIEEEA